MNAATAQLIVAGITALMQALPAIIEAIQDMNAPKKTKAELIARIRKAQESLPEWE